MGKCKHRVVLSPDEHAWFQLYVPDDDYCAANPILLRMKQLGWHPDVDVLGPGAYNLVPRHDPFLVEAVLQLQSEGILHDGEYRVAELQSDRYALASYDGAEYLIEPYMMVSWHDHPLPEEYIEYTRHMTGWGSGIRDTLARFMNERNGDQY